MFRQDASRICVVFACADDKDYRALSALADLGIAS
jgi:hypothetical protein